MSSAKKRHVGSASLSRTRSKWNGRAGPERVFRAYFGGNAGFRYIFAVVADDGICEPFMLLGGPGGPGGPE